MATSQFDTKAADWDKNHRRQILAEKVAAAIASLLHDKKVKALEFGCGTGLVGLELAQFFTAMTAVDTSKEMIRVLADKLKKEGLSHITPLQQDIVSEPLSERFQLIFTSMALHHVQDIDEVLQCLADHLEPDGMLAIADLDENEQTFHNDHSHGFTHNGFNRETLAAKLQDRGFSVPEFVDVHTIFRNDKNGNEHPFTVFLLSCNKIK